VVCYYIDCLSGQYNEAAFKKDHYLNAHQHSESVLGSGDVEKARKICKIKADSMLIFHLDKVFNLFIHHDHFIVNTLKII